jgi:hypothetical protein
MAKLLWRFQVLLSPYQFARLQDTAQAKGVSVGALIRQAIKKGYLNKREKEQLQAIERLRGLSLPIAHWEQMEREPREECRVLSKKIEREGKARCFVYMN